MNLFDHCTNYTDKVLNQSSSETVNEHIYNLCIQYLIEDNPTPYTIAKLKAFFKIN